MLKEASQFHKYYQRIVRHIQTIMPQFQDFELTALPGNDRYVRLNWTDVKSADYLFGPDRISDGSLRFMALATQFMQLLDEFNADQVVVVECDQTTDGSVFKQLDVRQLAEWLDRYSLSDIQTWLKQNSKSDCRFTSMFDLYGLPDDFPDYAEQFSCRILMAGSTRLNRHLPRILTMTGLYLTCNCMSMKRLSWLIPQNWIGNIWNTKSR